MGPPIWGRKNPEHNAEMHLHILPQMCCPLLIPQEHQFQRRWFLCSRSELNIRLVIQTVSLAERFIILVAKSDKSQKIMYLDEEVMISN